MNLFRSRRAAETEKLRKTVGELQHAVDILQRQDRIERRAYTGNPYPCYKDQVEALSRMYNARAEWGIQTCENVISLRAAFTIGGGVKAVPNGSVDATRELEMLRRFIAHNELDQEVPFDWMVAAEIEGKLAIGLYVNQKAVVDGVRGMIDARYLSWRQLNYTVKADPRDYASYLMLTYQDPETKTPIELEPPAFVFRRFGGEITDVNEPTPKLANVIQEMEHLSQIRVDWRKVNNLFAGPTPVAIAGENQTPADLKKDMGADSTGKISWRYGKMLILGRGGDFKMVGPDPSGYESLKEEEIADAKRISGHSGIPIHYFGHADVMSNRAVADSLFSLIISSVSKERKTAAGLYTSLFRSAIEMYNRAFQGGLNPSAVRAEVPQITEGKMQDIRENWLPLYMAGLVPARTVIQQIPDVNVEEIEKLLSAETEARMRTALAIAGEQDHAGDDGADQG